MWTEEQKKKKLEELLALPSEKEWLEFKKAGNNFNTDDLGKYFSALANEANLHNTDSAWLIFGIEDQTHEVVGTQYKASEQSLEELKIKIADNTNGLSFKNIHTIIYNGKRIIMFEIPPAPQGIPVSWKNFYYGRDYEALVALSISKLEKIRKQRGFDWSSQIVKKANIDILDNIQAGNADPAYDTDFPSDVYRAYMQLIVEFSPENIPQ